MLRLLLAIPAVLVSLVWSAFFPAKPALAPPAPAPVPGVDAPTQESQDDGHELSDAKPRTVALFVIGLFFVIFSTMAALGFMYTHLYNETQAIPVRPAQASFKHAPAAKTSIDKDWQSIDTLAHQRLDHYAWADSRNNVVRIPIARAVDLVASEGLPARADQKTPFFPPPDQEKLPLMELEHNANALDFDPHHSNATAHSPH